MNTKKNLIGAILLFSSLILVGCNKSSEDINVADTTSLAQILSTATQIQLEYERGEITIDKLNELAAALEKKYQEITLNEVTTAIKENISKELDKISTTINNVKNNDIPNWVSKLGIIHPTGLEFIVSESKQTSLENDGYDSIVLVYEGDYDIAIEQAAQLAQKANIGISPEFKAVIDALSGDESVKDIRSMIYSNHGLFDTDIDYLITISVNENGNLTIEAINYKQMENR